MLEEKDIAAPTWFRFLHKHGDIAIPLGVATYGVLIAWLLVRQLYATAGLFIATIVIFLVRF